MFYFQDLINNDEHSQNHKTPIDSKISTSTIMRDKVKSAIRLSFHMKHYCKILVLPFLQISHECLLLPL